MLHSRWIRRLLGTRRSRSQRRRQAAQIRKSVRPLLEPLEDRLTPSGGGTNVTQTAGSYADLTGLIAGDTAANTNYIIQITGSFTFDSGGQVTISKLDSTSTLTIETPTGTSPFTLTGNGNRLFDVVGASQNVTLANLTLTGGSAINDGGALEDQGGNVTLSGVTVKTNTATGILARGGGVFVSGAGSLTLTNSNIQNNVAQGISGTTFFLNGDPAEGGGVFVSGPSTVRIVGGSLSGNRAIGGNGAPNTAAHGTGGTGGDASGGGLYFTQAGWTLTIAGTTVSGNSAIGGDGGIGGNGVAGAIGATGLDGGGGVNGTILSPNGTGGGNGNAGGVGGIGSSGGLGGAGGSVTGGGASLNGGGKVTLSGVTFATDSASGGRGGTGGMGGQGGNGGAGGAGGQGGNAFLPILGAGGNGGIGGNGGTGGVGGTGGTGGSGGSAQGGALFVGTGPITLTIQEAAGPKISTYLNNSANGGGGGSGGAGGVGGQGGTGGKGGAGGTGLTAGLTGTGGNGGNGGRGGIGGTGGSAGLAQGGGLFVGSGSTVLISAANFQSNTAQSGTGGTGGGAGTGGAGGNPGGTGSLMGFGGNGAAGGTGGTGGAGSLAEGGGIFSQSSTTLLKSSVVLNQAFSGSSGAGGTGGTGGNGAVGVINGAGGQGGNGGGGGIGGTASGGGAYYSGVSPVTDLTINTTFGANKATGGVGGLGGKQGSGGVGGSGTTAAGGNVGISGTAATATGGGAFLTLPFDSSATFINDTFNFNSATTSGGGIYNQAFGVAPLLVNTILENNQAPDGPDYFGTINANNNFNFVSNTVNSGAGGTTWNAAKGNILNNTTPQLENTLSSATLPGGGTSPLFYRLLPGSILINAGTPTVLHTIAAAEIAAGELPPGSADDAAVDETLVDLRSNDSGNLIDLGAVQFVAANSTLNVTILTPGGPFKVPFGTTSLAVTALVTQGTNPGSLPVTSGVVTFNLVGPGGTIAVTTANVGTNGEASTTIPLPPNLPVGTYTITASYSNANIPVGTPASVTFSNTASTTLTVSPASTSVTPASPSVLLGATSTNFDVLVSSPGGTVSGGTVSVTMFFDSTSFAFSPASVVNGVATISTTTLPALPVGSYELVESYSGDTDFTASSALGTLTVTISSTTVVPGNAKVNLGSSAPFSIVVGVNSPDGTVNGGSVAVSLVSDGTVTSLGTTGTVTNGTATLKVTGAPLTTIAALQTGNYQLIETYSGAGPFAGSSATGTLSVTTSPTTVVPGNATVNFGSTSPFTILVGVNSPDGTVKTGTVTVTLVSNNTTTLLGAGTLGSSGTATVDVTTTSGTGGTNPLTTIAALMPGNYQLIETYTDVTGGQFASSSGSGTLTINAAPTTVVPGNVSVNFGSTAPFSISATVNSANSTVSGGTVTFDLINGNTTTLLGTATVGTNGVATLKVPAGTLPANLQTGKYELVETYSGNSPFAGSSAIGTLTVTAAPTSVAPGNVTVNFGGSPGFAMSMEVNSSSGTVNSGNVTVTLVFGSSTVTLGTAPVVNGTATLTVPAGTLPANLAYGKYDLEESYADVTGGQFAASGAAGTFTVAPTPTPPTSVIPGNAFVNTNDGIQLITAAVNSPNGPVTTGTVTISLVMGNSSMVVGSAPVSNGVANVSANIPVLTAGTYQLIETYSDSTGRFGGSSAIGTLVAEPIPQQLAALELAIDAAALVSLNNPGAIMELKLFSDVILHYQIPTSIPALVNAIQTLFPKTGALGLPSLATAMFLAQDLAQENPM